MRKPFTCTNITENTNTSVEVSPIEKMETIIHFNSTLLDDGTLFSSHTVNTLIDREDKGWK